jgi:glutathione synthase
MSRNVAIQMDHPLGLNPAVDSTIALVREAAKRGHRLQWYHPTSLRYAQGELRAMTQLLSCADGGGDAPWCALGESREQCLADMDVILMRQDPPFDMAYLSATYLLEHLPASTRVLNNPAYVRNYPEKLAILDFADAIPPTLVSADEDAIMAFAETHQKIVAKPLYGFGGHSIYVFAYDDPNLLTFLEQYRNQTREPLMLQAFLPEVKAQDIRVLLIDGKVSGALGRIPAEGSIRANMRVGGTPVAVALNDRQQSICDRVGAKLKSGGVLFAGLDLIGDYLTEVNITSPTGIVAAQKLYDECDPAADFWDAVERI